MKYVSIPININVEGNTDKPIVIITVKFLFFVTLSTKWCRCFKSPLNGCFPLIILNTNNLNISIAGISKIIKTSSPNKKLSKFLYRLYGNNSSGSNKEKY